MAGPAIDERGGVSTVVQLYAEGGLFDDSRVRYLPSFRSGSRRTKVKAALRAWIVLAWLLLRGRVAGLHVLMGSHGSFWRKGVLCLMATVARRPYVVHVHGASFDAYYAAARGWHRALIARLFRHAAAVVALSPAWIDKLRPICPTARLQALRNPMRLGCCHRPAERRPDQLLFLGEISPRKGIAELIEAFARLRRDHPQLRLAIGGTGDDALLAAAAARWNVRDAIDMLGWVTGADKGHVLQTATALALPSFQEGQPMVILEAMAAGLPIVASRVGGIPDTLTDEVDGLLVDAGDVDQLTTALDRVLRNPLLADRLATQARRRAEAEFALPAVLDALRELHVSAGLASR